jgi:hypothetical protein
MFSSLSLNMCILYFVIANVSTPWREIVALKRTFFRTFWNMHITFSTNLYQIRIDLQGPLSPSKGECTRYCSMFHYTPLEPL